jgi:hypothetical protein
MDVSCEIGEKRELDCLSRWRRSVRGYWSTKTHESEFYEASCRQNVFKASATLHCTICMM